MSVAAVYFVFPIFVTETVNRVVVAVVLPRFEVPGVSACSYRVSLVWY